MSFIPRFNWPPESARSEPTSRLELGPEQMDRYRAFEQTGTVKGAERLRFERWVAQQDRSDR